MTSTKNAAEQAKAEQAVTAMLAWLDALAAERLPFPTELPSGLGFVSKAVGPAFLPEHLMWHAAQVISLRRENQNNGSCRA